MLRQLNIVDKLISKMLNPEYEESIIDNQVDEPFPPQRVLQDDGDFRPTVDDFVDEDQVQTGSADTGKFALTDRETNEILFGKDYVENIQDPRKIYPKNPFPEDV